MSAHGIKHWVKVLDDALAGHPAPAIAIDYAFEALPRLGVTTDRWNRLRPGAVTAPAPAPAIPPNLRRAAEYFADEMAA